MNVRRIDQGQLPPAATPSPALPKRAQAPRTDVFERSAAGSEVSSTRATYGPGVRTGESTGTRNAEATMGPDARAAKLAAIEKRIQEGVYDTRQSIERVVDRLLDKWNLGFGRSVQRSGD